MVNHGWTLLLNVDPTTYSPRELGGEYVPPDFKPLALPSYLERMRNLIYGPDPDVLMRNYRSRQLLSLVHATELKDYLLSLDRRVTYDFQKISPLLNDVFGLFITPQSSGELLPITSEAVIEGRGRCIHRWNVTVDDSNSVTVNRSTPPTDSSVEEYTLDGPLSSIMPLTGSALQFRLNDFEIGDTWRVESRQRPSVDLGTVAQNLKQLGEANFLQLFGTGRSRSEPYQTFANLWYDNHELHYQLGGLTLAMIYRTHELL